LKDLYVSINEEAKQDFDNIFILEEKLKKAGFQSVLLVFEVIECFIRKSQYTWIY
jgi:hypothetical protein